MSLMEKEMYEFGPFSLDSGERVLSRGGAPLTLTPKVFDTLLCLVRNRGRLLTKDELLKEIWPDTFVEEVNLAVNISTLRKAFGENPQDGRYIVTVPGSGYRFVAEVREVFNGDKTERNPPMGSNGEFQFGPEEVKPSGLGTHYQSVPDLPTNLQLLTHELERAVAKTNHSRALLAPASLERGQTLNRAALAAFILLALAVAAVAYLRLAQARRIVPAPKAASIAVLPFVDMSPHKDQEYFSDGLAEALINDLAKVQGVRVVARSSAFQFKGKNEDIRSVGRKLGVANILEGSVQREGDHVRIRAELTKADDGFQLWSETYDRKVDDIFTVEEEIARAATGVLQVKLLSPDGAAFSASARGTNSKAYQAYLQGRYFMGRSQERADLERALAYSEEAIKLDPKYAPAWVLRSDIVSSMVFGGLLESTPGFRTSREYAVRAIELDPGLASAYEQLASDQIVSDWDWEGAAASLQKAAELEPGSADVLHQQAYLDLVLDRLDAAIETQNHALTLDPLKARSYSFLGFLLYAAGQYEDARAALGKSLELNPQSQSDHFVEARILLEQARSADAKAQCDQEPRELWRMTCEAMAYQALGRPADSEAALKKLIATHSSDWSYQIAEVYAYRKESGKAFEWLNRAYEQRDDGLLDLKFDPLLKGLRRDPRYTELLKKMHLPV